MDTKGLSETEDGRKIQWSKDNGQKDKQGSTKHYTTEK